jgi:hypothetical protein
LHYLAQVLQLVPLRVQEPARALQLALAPVLVSVQRLAVQQAVFLALALALALALVLGRAAGLEAQGEGWQVLQEQNGRGKVCVSEQGVCMGQGRMP